MSYRWTDGRQRKLLPIDAKLDEIVDLLSRSRYAVIEAEPGAGKSVRLAQAVHLAVPDMPIWLIQPLRNAVRLLGRRISEELGTEPGDVVGWKLFGEDPVESPRTWIRLRTYEAMANMIHGQNGALPEGLIIVDEAHLRSIEGDLLLAMIQEKLSRSTNTWVWITSATIDTQRFAEYLGGAPIISVPGRCHPVSTEGFLLRRNESHTEGSARAAIEILERWAASTLVVPTEDGIGRCRVDYGTILVLLPGKAAIRRVISALGKSVTRLALNGRVEILPCHGESSPAEEDAVQAPLAPGMLRIVCGTEVIRSSVTLPRVKGVIDSLRVNRSFVDADGIARLDEIPVSAAEANQAKGRAGRTETGFYMPVSERTEYETLDQFPLPAILREPLTTVTLRLAQIGRSMRTFCWLDHPDPKSVSVAIARLQRLAAMDDSERITSRGRLLLKFPIDPELGMALITANQLGVLAETMIVVAALEFDGFFNRPKGRAKEVTVTAAVACRLLHMVQSESWGLTWDEGDSGEPDTSLEPSSLPKWIWPLAGGSYAIACGELTSPFRAARDVADLVWQAWAGETGSDFVSIVRAYRDFKAVERRLQTATDSTTGRGMSSNKREDLLRAWCDEHFINFKRMLLADHSIRKLREAIGGSSLSLRVALADHRHFDAAALTKALASGLTTNVAVHSGQHNHYDGGLGRFEIGFQSIVRSNQPPLILFGALAQVPGIDGRKVLLTDHAAVVEPRWLAEVMPQFCTPCGLGDLRYDPAQDQVIETVSYSLHGKEVGRESVIAADGTAAAKVFAEWLADRM